MKYLEDIVKSSDLGEKASPGVSGRRSSGFAAAVKLFVIPAALFLVLPSFAVLISAFEAHVVNVTATIENRPQPPCVTYTTYSMGFWKTHSSLWIFPQTLGTSTISTSSEATAVFNASNSVMRNKLKKQLLALEFTVAQTPGVANAFISPSATTTIGQLITDANALLSNPSATQTQLENMKNAVEAVNEAGTVRTCHCPDKNGHHDDSDNNDSHLLQGDLVVAHNGDSNDGEHNDDDNRSNCGCPHESGIGDSSIHTDGNSNHDGNDNNDHEKDHEKNNDDTECDEQSSHDSSDHSDHSDHNDHNGYNGHEDDAKTTTINISGASLLPVPTSTSSSTDQNNASSSNTLQILNDSTSTSTSTDAVTPTSTPPTDASSIPDNSSSTIILDQTISTSTPPATDTLTEPPPPADNTGTTPPPADPPPADTPPPPSAQDSPPAA